jgi:hypothetical protein
MKEYCQISLKHSFMNETITAIRKYNYWSSNTIDLWKLRTDFTEKITH